jgi:uncharacterized SAM-binding protein YcdF (DUF218 family)
LLLILGTGYLPAYLVNQTQKNYPPINTIDSSIHWVVVLGGGHYRGDTPANTLLTQASLNRLIEGVRLYKALPQAKLILSGGGFDTKISEAEHLKTLAHTMGVPETDIVLETQSINTKDEFEALEQIIPKESFYLVTSVTHMKRAFFYAKKAHLHPIAAPTDYNFYWSDERLEKMLLLQPRNLVFTSTYWREFIGLVWAKISP